MGTRRPSTPWSPSQKAQDDDLDWDIPDEPEEKKLAAVAKASVIFEDDDDDTCIVDSPIERPMRRRKVKMGEPVETAGDSEFWGD